MQSRESPRSAGAQAPAYAPPRDAAALGFATQWVVVALFGGTVFLSAFLLFQVQPLIGKRILPWFGGTPSVFINGRRIHDLRTWNLEVIVALIARRHNSPR